MIIVIKLRSVHLYLKFKLRGGVECVRRAKKRRGLEVKTSKGTGNENIYVGNREGKEG